MKAVKKFLAQLGATVLAVVGVVAFCNLVIAPAISASTPNEEIATQLKEQNRQLGRIATSLEIISGQHSGWKLPKP